MRSPCACGACDRLADEGSRYSGDHYRRLVAARRKWRRLTRYAALHGIPLGIRLEQILALVHERWPDTSWQLRRADRRLGFVAENIVVLDRRARTPTNVRLLIERAGSALRARRLASQHTVEHVLQAFNRQGGRCAVSGRKLRVTGRGTDGDALDIRPSTGGDAPLVLVTRAVAEHELRWGARHLRDLARSIVEHAEPSGRGRERRRSRS